MPITETDLPGVGKKYKVDLDDETALILVIHNTGPREVYLRSGPDSDAEKLFELPDRLARIVGTIMEGAYFQPIEDTDRSTTIGQGVFIEWYDVQAGSDIEGRTLATILQDERIEVAVVGVEREGEVFPASQAKKTVRSSDTIIAVGSRDELSSFESLLSG